MKTKLAISLLSLITAFMSFTYLNYSVSFNSIYNLQQLQCGLTEHFKTWLSTTDYKSWNFNRADILCGSLGGRGSFLEEITNTPIVFIHGNSDIAYGRGTTDGKLSWQTGFRALTNFFVSKGYKRNQLYTTTWGTANPNQAANMTHSKDNVMRIRKFIQAVLEYTKKPQIHVIGHSMGVTIARKALKGGKAVDHSGQIYEVGQSLKDKVKVFIGLAGANYGLNSCWAASSLPTCNAKDGFYPGAAPSSGPSTFLNQINKNSETEAEKVYTIWSKDDQVIMYNSQVWGKITCRIPGQTEQIEKQSGDWGHFAIRDNTGDDIYNWIK